MRLDDNGRPYLANGPRDAVERHRRGLDMRGVDVSGGAAVVRGCPYSDLRGWRASSPRPWDETAKEMAARLAREEEDGEEEEGEGAGGGTLSMMMMICMIEAFLFFGACCGLCFWEFGKIPWVRCCRRTFFSVFFSLVA